MEMADNLPPLLEYQLLNEATQDVLMIIKAQEGNSLTPKVDVPLAPPNLESNKPILDILTMIQKQLKHSKTCLAVLENPNTNHTWGATSANPRNEDGYLHGTIADIDYLHLMPEQLELLQQKEEMECIEYYDQLDLKEQHRMNKEEQHIQAWKTMTPDE